MSDGVVDQLEPTGDELVMLRDNVRVVTEKAATGIAFLNRVVAPLLAEVKPDLIWLNPLNAFFSADLNDQQAVAAFLRNTLNPLLGEHGCACFIIHHTTKPSAERKEWRGNDLAYFGAGSADLSNWAREAIALSGTCNGLYEMTCTKRWRKLGWTDPDGKPTGSRIIAHSQNGSQVWRDATPEVMEELGARPYSNSKLLEMVPDGGIDHSELVEKVATEFSLTVRTATKYLKGLR